MFYDHLSTLIFLRLLGNVSVQVRYCLAIYDNSVRTKKAKNDWKQEKERAEQKLSSTKECKMYCKDQLGQIKLQTYWYLHSKNYF